MGSIKVVCTSRNITTTQLKYPNIYNYTPYYSCIVMTIISRVQYEMENEKGEKIETEI